MDKDTAGLVERLRFIATARADSNRRDGRRRKEWAKEAEIEWKSADAIEALSAAQADADARVKAAVDAAYREAAQWMECQAINHRAHGDMKAAAAVEEARDAFLSMSDAAAIRARADTEEAGQDG